jgi:hypothetical protein
MKGGDKTDRSPVDQGRTGSKHHVIVEAHSIPLAATLTGGNRNDVTQLIPLLQAVPPIRGARTPTPAPGRGVRRSRLRLTISTGSLPRCSRSPVAGPRRGRCAKG